MQKNTPIGDTFVASGLITQDQLNQAIEKQKLLKSEQPIGELLVGMGFITEKDSVKCLGEQWGVQYVDLSEIEELDQSLTKMIGQNICRKLKVMPIEKTNGKLSIAMKNPLDIFAIDEIRMMTGLDVEPCIATEEDIVSSIARLYHTEESVSEQVSNVIQEIETDEIEFTASDSEDDEISIEQLRELSEEAPVIKLANLVISRGINDGASDIHIEPAKDRVRVRNRVDGILHEVMAIPKKAQASLISRFKIMAELDIATKRSPQDGRIGAVIDGKQFDFRVSTLPSVFGEKIVLRVLDKSAINIGLNKLGLLPETLERFESLVSRTYGIILVTGPTGSGKSTTLYSVLNKLNTGEKNILTIEDPVEYEVDGLTQVQINNKANLTCAAGLRSMLRQDPDIAMVGEIRDQETALIATEAALTGHLVLSTLHTNDAPGALTRLVDMEVEPFLVASSVIGVIAQRLVRVVCPKCKEQYQPPQDAVKRLGIEHDKDTKVTFYRGRGCDHCRGVGYKGRVGVYELLIMNDRIRDLVLQRASGHLVREVAIETGMVSLKDDAITKILLGVTTLEESLRVIYSG